MVLLLFLFPFVCRAGNVLYVCNMIGIAVIGALGLNLLTGLAGLVSLAHGAFLGIGAYVSAYLVMDLELPFWLALPGAGLLTALCGLVFAIPALRLKGLYLAVATLAAQFIVEYLLVHLEGLTGGVLGKMVDFPVLAGFTFDTDISYYYLILTLMLSALLVTWNIGRTRPGRALVAIRDQPTVARMLGINVFRYQLGALGFSSFLAGLAGSLWAHYVSVITPEHFTLGVSVEYLAMIVVGGLGRVSGSVCGAVFMVLLPELLRLICGWMSADFPVVVNLFAAIREGAFGLVLIVFLLYQPRGLAGSWQRVTAIWRARGRFMAGSSADKWLP